VRQVDQFGKTGGIELKDAEVKVAHQLVEALAADFDPKKYSDTFEENVKKLIQARLEGKEVTPVEKPRKPAPVVDLMAALKESLAQIPKKPAQRVAEAQRPVAISSARKSGRKKQGVA
jgi:DNA end-binding protein Ku